MAWLTETLIAAAVIAAGAAAGLALYFASRFALRVMPSAAWRLAAESIVARCAGGLRVFLPLVGVYASLGLALEDPVLSPARLGMTIVLIAVSAYLLIRVMLGVEDFVTSRLGLEKADNLDARRIHTQLRLLRRVLVAFISFTAVIVVLLFLPGFRQIGAGLLASAGIAGLVIGFAAQRALGNLLAGFQIAVSQPIRRSP